MFCHVQTFCAKFYLVKFSEVAARVSFRLGASINRVFLFYGKRNACVQPFAVHQKLAWAEPEFVIHLRALSDPVTQIDIGQAKVPGAAGVLRAVEPAVGLMNMIRA